MIQRNKSDYCITVVELPSTSCRSAAAWAFLNKNQAREPASGRAATCVRAPFVESCPSDAAPVRVFLLLKAWQGKAGRSGWRSAWTWRRTDAWFNGLAPRTWTFAAEETSC